MHRIFLEDFRVKSLSGIGTINTAEYINLVEEVYNANGGIDGQRAPLKTKTGITIRKRMIDDLRKGTVLPPIVIGAVVSEEVFEASKACTTQEQFAEILAAIDKSSISIIDGMQRTTAISEILRSGETSNMAQQIRIDLWIAKNINSLIYRMLVLNTGQVSWDIKRQLETIYKHIVRTVQDEVGDIDVINIDGKERRSDAGQYRSTRIIELFLAFTSRRPHVELKEKVAEDFARMDATEATANEDVLPAFIFCIKQLAKLDKTFAQYKARSEYIGENTKFKEGKDLFTSAPASIGFVAAISQYLLGEPGYPFNTADIKVRMEQVNERIDDVVAKMRDSESPVDFFDFLLLNEKISRKSGKIGEFEREFFFRAFAHMIENSEKLTSLTPCWSAY